MKTRELVFESSRILCVKNSVVSLGNFAAYSISSIAPLFDLDIQDLRM